MFCSLSTKSLVYGVIRYYYTCFNDNDTTAMIHVLSLKLYEANISVALFSVKLELYL